ncbi:type 4a pilus biogenesis protein PilO [Candidatus Berkelbacteria bacterium]|uniref:Uncharacterized protein n=1 Tax=Candidatus Berkelbacteria bacterium CG10_big_fil_rev_8_21_14_0_10_43_14 TaxID=1974515 RepID=A0A2M6R9B1_9BACT|nr:type 4a pilus biogenesis protein PilO [Candidatus Berkelbacteria bacterium]PIS07188.1 MAG: hypothetical protein COT79_00645 [Candidatus Berkelbacteria bacterium CG10_big_fil_rev_8_21_14_0_10_43_14]PIU87511.1 MAG: hypothetical protein COS66_00500 [Candidatus Berkelbacteria bacterium CG06_land_8_20_14_3_00_43_10]
MTKQHQTLAVAGATIVSIVLIYFGIMPKMNALKGLTMQAQAKSQEADVLTAQVNDLKKFSTELTQNAVLFNTLKVALPAEPKIDEAFIMINEIAHASGVELSNVQPKSNSAGAGDLQLSLSATGDFESLIRFTQNLRSNQRPTIVKNVSISAKATSDTGDGQKTTQLSGSFDIAMATSAQAQTTASGTSTTGGGDNAAGASTPTTMPSSTNEAL